MPPQQSTDFFQYLGARSTGILTLFLGLAALVLFIQWLAWIFGRGRFKHRLPADASTARSNRLRFLLADLLIKIIDDFRHLLALVIVVIFALALAVAMYIGSGSIENLKEALQIVVATLGGLVGSIIGYYFGESTVARQQATTAATTREAEQGASTDVEEQNGSDATERIEPIPTPPALRRRGAVDDPDQPDTPNADDNAL